MRKYLKILIILILIIIFAVGVFIIYSKTQETKFNDEYVNGNTAGNLYSGGFFCEYDDTIYFSNPDDGNKIYSMNSEGTNVKKISNEAAGFINVDENYIYYIRNNPHSVFSFTYFTFQQNSLCRMNKDGSNITILDSEPCNYAALCGNYIYYLRYDAEDASTLNKIKIDGTEQKQISKTPIYTCCTNGQYIYYHGMDTDGSIYRLDTASDIETVIYECSSFMPILTDSTSILYLDGAKNNVLTNLDLTTNETEIISKDSIDFYNTYRNTIYYQCYSKDGNALCLIKNDGTQRQELREGDFCNIHTTSNFLFFIDYHTEKVYYSKHSDPTNIREFHPGIDD